MSITLPLKINSPILPSPQPMSKTGFLKLRSCQTKASASLATISEGTYQKRLTNSFNVWWSLLIPSVGGTEPETLSDFFQPPAVTALATLPRLLVYQIVLKYL